MNSFTKNGVDIDWSNLPPLAGSASAGLTVSRKLFHGERHIGVHAEGEGQVMQQGVTTQLEEDSGAVACGEISHDRFSGSVDVAKCSQVNPAASSEIEVLPAPSIQVTEDFPQDLSINTLEEICQVTELLAASTGAHIECSQDVGDTNRNVKTPVRIRLSSPDKTCLCRTSTPVVQTDKHSKFDSVTKKKRIKFVHVPASEKLNKHDENVRLVKENIQIKSEFEEWPHGGDSVPVQATSELSSDNGSVVDIASRVQTIKMAVNQIKKFTYVPANVEMRGTITQNKDLNVWMEDVVKSAQAMENVVGTEMKQNDTGKLNGISNDRQGFIPFCKLQGPSRFVAEGEVAEDLKRTNAATNKSDGTGKPILSFISSDNSLIGGRISENCSIESVCDQATSSSNLGSIKEFSNISGGTNAECSDVSSTPFASETCQPEVKKFQQKYETKSSSNTSNAICDTQEYFSKQLGNELPSSNKEEMEYEFSRLNQGTKILGFKTAIGKQIKLSDSALLKDMMLMDDVMAEEKMHMIPDMASSVPGQNSVCEELKDTKVNAVYPSHGGISCELSSVTVEDTCGMFDNVYRQGPIANNKVCHVTNFPMICASSINKQETVMHAEYETNKNFNHNETVTEVNTLGLLENKTEQENMMTDSQMVLAAENAELLQQLAEDGSIFSQWPNEVHDRQIQNCGKINNPSTKHKFHGSSSAREGIVSETCAFNQVARDLLEDVNVSDGRNKPSSDKLSLLHTSDGQDVEMSEQILQQARQLHEKGIVCDSTIRGEIENNRCNEVVQSMKASDDVCIKEVKLHSEEVDVEAILNTTVIRQLFNDNLDTFKMESRVQTTVDKPECDILNVDHSLLTPALNRMQNEQPEMSGSHKGRGKKASALDVSLQKAKTWFPECDASDELMVETFLSKGGRDLSMTKETVTNFPTEHPETREFSRAVGRKPLVSIVAIEDTLKLCSKAEDEKQNSEDIRTIDSTSDSKSNNKITKLNTAVSELGVLERMAESEEMSKVKSLMSSNDNSIQEPMTNSRHLIAAANATSLEHLKFNDCVADGYESFHERVENSCCLLETENHLQQLLQQSFTTANCQTLSVFEGTADNVEVPDGRLTFSTRTAENCGDSLQNAGRVFGSADTVVVDSITNVSGRKTVASANAVRNAKHTFSETDIDANSDVQNAFTPMLEFPEAVDSAVVYCVSNAHSFEHGTGCSELEGTEKKDPPVSQGFASAGRKKISASAKALSRETFLFSDKESENGELGTQPLEIKQISEKVSLSFNKCKTTNIVQISEALNTSSPVVSEADTTVGHETESRELKERGRQDLPILQGFVTASGKKVCVSDKALNSAKLLLSEYEICTEPAEDETRSLELKEPEKCSSSFSCGFSTASGKRIRVSGKALNRAKLVFSEEETCTLPSEDEVRALELDEPEKLSSPVSHANERRIPVSANSLSRTKHSFLEEETCTKLAEAGTGALEVREAEGSYLPILQGFSTASGKKVSVSAMALKRAKLLFSDEESCIELVKNETGVLELKEMEEKHSPVIQGFSTASGKRVSVSSMALKRAKLLFSDKESGTEHIKNKTEVPKSKETEEQHSPILQGFSTASGKKVSESAMALKRAKLLFSDEESCTELVKNETGVPELKETEEQHSPVLQGFSTASGKKVSVSAMALKRAKLLFSDEESCTELVKNERGVPELKEMEEKHSPVLQGFSTASGKRVSVSSMALKRAKLLFSEKESGTEHIRNETGVPELKETEEQHSPVLQRFSTASGKKVSVSSMALKRAKLLFSDKESVTELVKNETGVSELNEMEEKHSAVLQGFSTASGKRVSVSSMALKRAKPLFSDEESCTELVTNETGVSELKEMREQHSPVLQGFSTASGKKVSVSAMALKRAELLFSEKGSCTELVKNETGVPEFKEVKEQCSPVLQDSTASGKHDSVSAKFLNRDNNFISEVESDQYMATSKTNYSETEISSVVSEISPRLEKASVSKDKPRKVKLKLSRRVSGQNRSNSSFKIPQSPQINSFRPFFLNKNQRETQDCEEIVIKQNTCISEELCPELGTLSGFTSSPDFKRKLYRNSVIQVHGYITDTTATEVVEDKESHELRITTFPAGSYAEEGSEREKVSVNLTQEVKESAAALLADEATFNSPSWTASYVSCPDMLYDRDVAPTALVCSEVKDCSAVYPGSPVLGSHDRCRKRRRVRMIADVLRHNSSSPTNSSFKVNHLHFVVYSFMFFHIN
jgi:hypothetical protein